MTCNYNHQHLELFNHLHHPIWIFDIEKKQMWWANHSAIKLWGAENLEELLSRDFGPDMSEITEIRLKNYLRQFGNSETVYEQWIFYPLGEPATVNCSCSGINIDDGRLAMLVEGEKKEHRTVETNALRSVEALRYTPAMISIFSLDGEVIFQNPAATQAFGIPEQDALSFRGRFAMLAQAQEAWSKVSNGQVFRAEFQVVTLEGTRWHDIHFRPSEDPGTGEPVILVNQQDITDKHLAQERYRQLFVGSKMPMLLIDPDVGSIVDANQAAADYYGYNIGQLQGMLISQINIFSPEKIKEEMQKAFRQNRNHFLFKHKLASGTIRDVEVHSGPVTIEHRRLLYSIIIDVTERLNAEEALSNSEARLRNLFELSPIGITLNNFDTGHFIEFNQAIHEAAGYSNEEFSRLSYWDLTPREYQQQEALQLESLRTKGAYGPYEKEYIHKNGQRYPVLLNGVLIDDPASNKKMVLSTVEDISERKLVEQKLFQAKLEAETANRYKSQFLATMSHEIRTPMTGVLGIAELLKDSNLDKTQQAQVKEILRSGQILITIINDILDYSKIASGHMRLESSPFNLKELVEETISLVANLAAEKDLSIKLSYNLDSCNYKNIFLGDPIRLRQIFTNLLGNAIKFTASGEVQLDINCTRTSKKQADFTFNVIDSGIGIAPEHLESLFDPFIQADQTTTRQFGGTGLGLSISSSLVEQMGGNITVTSEPGHGSIFSINLSLSFAEPSKHTVKKENDNKPEVRQQLQGKVLIVDDVKVNLMVTTGMLKRFGITTKTAENGKEAIMAWQNSDYDLILMDCRMPIMDGYEATRRIRNLEPEGQHIPIIALTANASNEDRELCIAAGMDDVITKPFQKIDLFTSLSDLLKQDDN